MLFFLNAVSYADEITGVVTGVNTKGVQVTVENIESYAIKRGAVVHFKLMMDGLEFEAGKGIVTQLKHGVLLIKVVEGSPDLDMQATLDAELKPSATVATSSPPKSEAKPAIIKPDTQSVESAPAKTVSTKVKTTASAAPVSTPKKQKARPAVQIAEKPATPSSPEAVETTPQRIYNNCVLREYQTGYTKILADKGAPSYILKNINKKYHRGIAAYIYLTGPQWNRRRNPQKARNYLMLIPESEALAFDKFNLGLIYHIGDGVAVDYISAAIHYKKWVETNAWFRPKAGVEGFPKEYPFSYHNLGCLYLNGRGVEQNRNYALNLFSQAAEHDYAPSVKILKELEAIL